MSSDGFDTKAFMKASFQPRMADVPVPALKQFFGDNEPLWKVRGLTGTELARSNQAASRNESAKAVLEAFTALSKTDKVDSLKQSLGLGEETPADLSKRLEQVTIASVEPKIDLETAVKLSEVAPIEFYAISNKIIELTGKGQDVEGKPKPSGKSQGQSS